MLDRNYESIARRFPADPTISARGFAVFCFLSETVPESKKAASGQVFDDRFVRQLNIRIEIVNVSCRGDPFPQWLSNNCDRVLDFYPGLTTDHENNRNP